MSVHEVRRPASCPVVGRGRGRLSQSNICSVDIQDRLQFVRQESGLLRSKVKKKKVREKEEDQNNTRYSQQNKK